MARLNRLVTALWLMSLANLLVSGFYFWFAFFAILTDEIWVRAEPAYHALASL